MMEKIIWTDNFSVGMEEIDNQHQMIASYINRLIETPNLSVRSVEFHNIVNEMLGYIKQHLKYEEKLLEKCNYPDLNKHKKYHFDFALKLNEFAINTIHNRKEMPAEFLRLLFSWWEQHILEEDMKYKPFLVTRE